MNARCGASSASSSISVSRRAARMTAKKPAQAGDRLFEAVVADGDVLPSDLQQIVLRDDLAGAGDQQEQDVELPLRDRDRFPGRDETASSRIELEGFEDEARA